jgi:hypothetical protein
MQQAERLRAVLVHLNGIDWAPVVLQYSRGLELLLLARWKEALLRLLASKKSTPAQRIADDAALRTEAAGWSIGH